MYKIRFTILLIFTLLLSGCTTKSPTQNIVNAGVAQIERAEQIIKNTETLGQCQEKADDSLKTAKETLINAGKSCESETSKLEADLLRWKGYFWVLVFGIGIALYFLLIRRLSKNVI